MTAILFDLDGPLVDSRAAITSCLNHALRQQGFPERTPEELYAHIGPALADAFAEIVGEPLDSETFSEPILEALGIRSRFDVVAGPDLNPFGETKATTIAAALEVVGPPARCRGRTRQRHPMHRRHLGDRHGRRARRSGSRRARPRARRAARQRRAEGRLNGAARAQSGHPTAPPLLFRQAHTEAVLLFKAPGTYPWGPGRGP
jgi:hypothetical protein